jgi:hypothetical protein
MDKRKDNGGKRVNAGRPAKADEQKLVERLSPMEDDAHKVLKDAIKSGEKWAVELFFKYMYGLPKQVVDMNTNVKGSIPINRWLDENTVTSEI